MNVSNNCPETCAAMCFGGSIRHALKIYESIYNKRFEYYGLNLIFVILERVIIVQSEGLHGKGTGLNLGVTSSLRGGESVSSLIATSIYITADSNRAGFIAYIRLHSYHNL